MQIDARMGRSPVCTPSSGRKRLEREESSCGPASRKCHGGGSARNLSLAEAVERRAGQPIRDCYLPLLSSGVSPAVGDQLRPWLSRGRQGAFLFPCTAHPGCDSLAAPTQARMV